MLVVDNYIIHKSSATQAVLAKYADRLEAFCLPTYSPDLNPIEPLWKKVKREATHLRYFPQFADLVAKVRKALEKFAGLPQELTALAGDYRELTPAAA